MIFLAAPTVRESIPMKRVTGAAICLAAGIRRSQLLEHLDRLPRCRAALAEMIETPEDFACRRILNTAKECASVGEALKPWKLFIRTWVGYPTQQIPKVQAAMREAQILMGNQPRGC
jgi:hypothetical protein